MSRVLCLSLLFLSLSIIPAAFAAVPDGGFVGWCKKAMPAATARSSLGILQTMSGQKSCEALYSFFRGREKLWLNSRRFHDIGFLRYFTWVKQLDLTDNFIRDPGPVADIPGLTHLWLGENEITDIRALGSMGQLQLLVLEDNRIRDPSPLRGCRKLQALDLGRNQIHGAGFVSSLPELRYLYLNHNQIRDLSPFAEAGTPDSPGAELINWDRALNRVWNPAESFKVFHLEGNPVVRDFWEGGAVQRNLKNCPDNLSDPELRSLCGGFARS